MGGGGQRAAHLPEHGGGRGVVKNQPEHGRLGVGLVQRRVHRRLAQTLGHGPPAKLAELQRGELLLEGVAQRRRPGALGRLRLRLGRGLLLGVRVGVHGRHRC